MRICVDAHMIDGRETGNEAYIAGLATALSCLPDVQCVAAVRPGINLPTHWSEGQPDLIELRPAGDWMRLAYSLPRACHKLRADILHVSYNAPFISPCPVVVTVHDVIFKRFPEFFSARDRLLFATLLPLTLRRASAIITDSESSRQDILEFYPFTAGKVHAIPLAVNPGFHAGASADERRSVRERYGISLPYILAVGNLQPRKNLGRLVTAYRRLASNGLNDYQLVLVGIAAYRSAEFRAEVKDLVESGRLVLTGYVPEATLSVLYSDAKVFVYPSLYEGFGLPILEAMACGTPVITSNVSSMPEVAGDAALLVDPLRVEQIEQALRAVLTQPALAQRLARRGVSQAARFSWRRAACEVAAVYRQVLEQRRRGPA